MPDRLDAALRRAARGLGLVPLDGSPRSRFERVLTPGDDTSLTELRAGLALFGTAVVVMLLGLAFGGGAWRIVYAVVGIVVARTTGETYRTIRSRSRT